MNYWYAARSTEIFLDLDSRRALRRAASVLVVAMRQKKLSVDQVFVYPTKHEGHYHMIIELRACCAPALGERLAWGLWMGNDRLRVAYVLARQTDKRVKALSGDLLVSKAVYHREPDAVCGCRRKHKPDAVTWACPAMTALLGEARSADYFARTGERRVKPVCVRVKPGLISRKDLKQWLKKTS